MGTPRLWARLASDAVAPIGVIARWRADLADEFPLARPFLVETGASAASWLCGNDREGCARMVHRYDENAVAACGATFDRCARVSVEARDLAIWRLDERRVLAAVARCLSLTTEMPASVVLDARATWLGRRTVGGLDMRFYAAPVADGPLCTEIAAADVAFGPGVCVVVAVAAPTAGLVARAASRGAQLVALADAATILEEGIVHLDLDRLFHDHRDQFVGLDPSTVLSRRKRLIIDYAGSRAWLDHQLVEFPSRARLPLNLLLALARHPSAMMSRRRLYPDVWRDDYAGTSAHLQYAGLIRQHRTALGKLAAFPISPTPGDDERGGWCLDLEADAVELWSEPPSPKQPIKQRKGR